MSRVLVRDDLKRSTPIMTTLKEFVNVLLEQYSDFHVPPRLSRIIELSSFHIHIYKNLDCEMVKRSIISNSRKMLRQVFVHKERTLINQLFKEIGDNSNVCVISLTNSSDSGHCIIGTSVFAMCAQGCYISYIAVAEKDPWNITEDGSFRECGVARLLVYSIQLLAHVTCNCWNLYCWSNNEQGNGRNDLWSKLGFSQLCCNDTSCWPREIEDFAVQFHLPVDHAVKAGLVPRGILGPIRNLDKDQILSLQYYKDGWFDYTSIAEKIDDDDIRLFCLKWLEEKIEFCDLPEGSPESAKKFYYIFSRRLEDMLKTIALTGEDEDLKEISQLEGYMSDIALDYCMMAMFFHVGNVFPIHTQVFNWWNMSNGYSNFRRDHFVDYEYTDCDIIEEFADDKEFTFVIPCFHGEHFYIIVRRWIEDEIFFFLNDSDYKTECGVYPKSTTSVSEEFYAFLMNSPLWHANVSVNWVRVPSKKQEEEECGFRTLLHSYILSMSDHPVTSLLPLTHIGSNKLKKGHVFSKYKKESLPLLCRQWVKDIMYSKKWQQPVWITDILQFKGKTGISSINSSYYLTLRCSSVENDWASTEVRESSPRPLQQDQQVIVDPSSTEGMQHSSLDVVPHFDDDIIMDHEDRQHEVDQFQQSLMDVAPHSNSNAAHTEVIEEHHNHTTAQICLRQPASNAVEQLYEEMSCIDVDDLDGSSDSSEYHGIGDAPWIKGTSTVGKKFCNPTTCSTVTHDAVESNISDDGSDVEFMECRLGAPSAEASQRQLIGKTLVIRTQNMAFTRQLETTDDSHSSSNVINNSGECLLDVEVVENRRVPLLDVEDDCSYRVIALEEQPPSQVHHLIRKRIRKERLSDKPICLIDTCCEVCNRPVKDTIKCVRCELYIHDDCGFLLSKDNHCCKNCFHGDEDDHACERRRMRLLTRKDTELSELWSSKFPRISSSSSVSLPKVPKTPPVTREQKTTSFNCWLSQVCYILCKKKKDGKYSYYGCHEGYENIQEIYSKYMTDTLFENEQDLLKQLQSNENLNRWCRLPKLMVRLIRSRGVCFSSNDKFIAYDKLEQQQWPFIRYNTNDAEQQCAGDNEIVDSSEEFVSGTAHISFGDANVQNLVDFAPKYFLYRWHHAYEKSKTPEVGNVVSNLLLMAMEQPNTWVRVEAGRYRLSSTYSPEARARMGSPSLPVVFRVQPPGEESCVFSSLVSAMHYLNDYKMRDMLSSYIQTSLCYRKMTAVSESRSRDAFASKLMNQKGKYKSSLMKNFDIFENQSMWPTLCILHSSDGGLSHAVTVVDTYIFDSTTYRAMVINRKNLDWCCGTDYYEAKFVGVYKAYRFINASASTHILIRKKEDIVRAIRAFSCLFTALYDDAFCHELAKYESNYQLGTDFLVDINKKMAGKPYCYNNVKIQEKNFWKLLSNFPVVPMVLLLGYNAESYRLITTYDMMFYDGSMNSGLPLDESTLKMALEWQTIDVHKINIVRGYMYQAPLKKV